MLSVKVTNRAVLAVFVLTVGKVPCAMSTLMIVQSCLVYLEATARTSSTISRANVPMDLAEKDARPKSTYVLMLNVSTETALINFTDTSVFVNLDGLVICVMST